MTTSNIIAIVVPLSVLFLSFGLGFLGLKRLEQFDKEIDKLRSDLVEQIRYDEAKASDDAQRFKDDIRSVLETTAKTVTQLAEAAVRDANEGRQQEIQQRWERFTQETNDIVARVERSLEPYSWLQSRSDEVDYLTGIHTVGVAHDRVTDFFNDGKVDIAIRIAEHAAVQDLPGSPEDYHNLAVELARHDQHPLAVHVVNNGLKRFPKNIDLLADAISYNLGNGDAHQADEFYQQIRRISFDDWNWRAFTHSGDYLQAVGRFPEALELYKQFQSQMPDDERCYAAPAGYLVKMGRHREAIEMLEDAMNKCKRASQSGLLLSQAYMEIGEYRKAADAADRAIEANADAQPSTNQSATIWHRANALDAYLHHELTKSDAELNDELRHAAFECIVDYITAIKLRDTLEAYRRRGPERLEILNALLKKHGVESDELMAQIERSASE
jgi:tetratricopeptide (TPR) repeat protein